ncbi:ATP-binding protein [Aliiglaciecola sp. CAU 1673]|uniref:ATP-binding protein n=1 Tax=Aliiglaciecola sp. CAU 1673 TaxID=3032595 RepID=UPI0023DC6CFD|nr:ATP-binding protein [Aliiglaciecola sp. CAU 1673]MDF2176967.1 ATP-binding protein [Aliiglaciecola sp. CAU 1673]
MPGLVRIVLIDTHLPGVVELKLDGHTNICGTNASGKTTLQRLIPVFYGEYPSRVVPATRDSFERWYLPRDSSFIIYEYRNAEEELCQLVLTSSGTGVNYRFIAKSFELDDYLFRNNNGQHSSLPAIEQARSLARSGYTVSNKLNTKEFRAVLQNDRAVMNTSSNSRELLGYSRLFAICQQSQSLRHIEKLAKAVHSREGKMETIKAMIAAILEEDGVQPPSSSLSRNKVEDWISECHLIKEFDAIRPDFSRLEQANHELGRNELRLAELRQLFSHDLTKLAATLVTQQGKLEETLLAIKGQEGEWAALRDGLNQKLSEARSDVKTYEADLERVEQEYQDWQDKDIETLQKNLQSLGQWQSQLEGAQSRYSLLTDQHQDVESSFNKRLAAISEKVSQELELYQEQQQDLKDKLADARADEQRKLAELRQDYQQQLTGVQQEYQQNIQELKVQQAEINSLLRNAGFNEFEQSQLVLLDESIQEAATLEDAGRDKLRRVLQELSQAQKGRSQASLELEQATKQFNRQQQQVQRIESLLYPGEGSLLEFVRREMPDWPSHLGKVINAELLARKDLKPGLDAKQESVFGLRLDLSALSTPEFAQSEKQLQGQLEQAQRELAAALEQQNLAEQTLAVAQEQLRNLELKQAQAESELRTLEANRRRLQQDKDQLSQEYRQALAERKQQNKDRLKDNEKRQQQLVARQQQALDEIKDQQRDAETELQFHWQQLTGELRQQIAQVEQHISQSRQQAANDKQQAQNWLQNELAKRGVDVEEIGQLRKQIDLLKADILKSENYRSLVKDYEHWHATVYLQHKVTWQQGLARARKLLGEAERELAKEDAAYKEKRSALKAQQSECEHRLKTAKEQEIEVQAIHRQLAKLSLPNCELPTDKHSISQRLNEGQSLLQSRERLLTDIKAYVEHFDSLIASQAGTGLSDTWERARQECSLVNAQGVRMVDHRRLVGHLDQLLNVIVPQKLHGLREQGRIFGADLSQYYKVLEDIDKRIVSQSRRISQEVEEELFLDGVSDSAVRIRSRISELEFWPELSQFYRLYQQWLEDGATELPRDEYAQSMRRVMDILGRAALSGGIGKLLDIELKLKEGKSDLVIRTDRQLNESSSHGMAYLILCKFLLAFTRLLRGEADAVIHWPIDELGTLHQSNVKKIFDACQNNNISVVGAFPNPESEVLTLFQNRYLIDKQTRQLQIVQPKVNAISAKLRSRRQQQEQEVVA